jgi:aspartate racemase
VIDPNDPRTGEPAEVLRRPETLGVLGGMGPLATVDFLAKVIERSKAQWDWQQLPIVSGVWPQVPDRVTALTVPGAPSPAPSLIACGQTLVAAGARCIAMPCNTIHCWYDELAAAVDVPVFHIVDEAIRRFPEGTGKVGLMATRGTLEAGLYQERLAAAGIECVEPSPEVLHEALLPAIGAVKRHNLKEATHLFEATARHLLASTDTIVLACTDLPPLLRYADPHLDAAWVDTNDTLAQACVQWAHGARASSPWYERG